MNLQILRQKWNNNEILLKNNKDKATFDALVLLTGQPLPLTYYVEETENEVDVYKPKDLKKLNFEHFFGDGDSLAAENALEVEPKHLLKILKTLLKTN